MSTQEFYIRKADEADARGPFNLEQLSSLAENGQVDPDTYFYDAAAEAWMPINGNAALMETLFPAKRSLRVKAKSPSEVKTLNLVASNEQEISVNDMLLAAEGRTPDTKGSADPAIAQARSAGFGMHLGTAILFVTAAAYVLPSIDLVMGADIMGLLRAPLPLLGLFNLVLGICFALGATGAYPTARFAATLGFGFAGTLYYLQGEPIPLACSAAACVGLYCCTFLVSMAGVILCGIIGLAGSVGLAYHLFTH